ncbi:MAG TPA: aconitase family protein [Candidatus Eisenbacteria bacterium]|nr:aconitase family protein [Candidatus Eisenbacteria bacterium]
MTSLTSELLEAHRAERGTRGSRGPRPLRTAFGAKHVVIEGHAGLLALRSFETLGIERQTAELALAGADEDPFNRITVSDEPAALERMARRRGFMVSRAGNGPTHQVYLARLAMPARLVLGTSRWLPSCGALGALALQVSPIEAAAALAGAPVDLPWPETFIVRLFGSPPDWLAGDDLALELERRLAATRLDRHVLEFQVIESGALRFADRVAVATRAPRLGAVSALFASDDVARAYLKAQGREPDWKAFAPPSADPESRLDVDFSNVEPLVSVPRRGVLRLRDLGEAPVSGVWIGPEASLSDLERFVRTLRSERFAAGLDCVITLGHRQLRESAARAGLLGALRAAGARVEVPLAMPRPRSGPGVALACGAPRARALGWHETGPVACAAAAVTGILTDPRQRAAPVADEPVSESYVIDDRLLERPPPEAVSVDGARENGAWPLPSAITGPLRGAVLLKLGDHVGVDRILPWGARVRPLAGDVERLADHLFALVDPGFGARARAEGQGWIVAGRELGGGPRREEIGLVAVTLGVRGMFARTFDPEFRRLLCQHGLLALRFVGDEDAAMIGLGDELEIPDLPEGLEQGKPLVVRNLTRGLQVTVHHDLDEQEVAAVRRGGLLATLRRETAGGTATKSAATAAED